MISDRVLQPRLALDAGKHTHPPNVVFIPGGAKSFKVSVSMTLEARATSVLASPKTSHTHVWAVLDENLRQVMSGAARHGLRVAGKSSDVTHMVMEGAENRDHFDLELAAAKLADGRSYTLICKSFGAVASLDFVAVAEPRRAAAGKPRKKAKAKARKTSKARPKSKSKPKRKSAARKSGKKK